MNVTCDNIGNFDRQALQISSDDNFLIELPAGFSPFEEFDKEFNLGATSTEQLHPITKNLSQTMHASISDGLQLLINVDEIVVRGLEEFIAAIDVHAPMLAEKIGKGGRVFLSVQDLAAV